MLICACSTGQTTKETYIVGSKFLWTIKPYFPGQIIFRPKAKAKWKIAPELCRTSVCVRLSRTKIQTEWADALIVYVFFCTIWLTVLCDFMARSWKCALPFFANRKMGGLLSILSGGQGGCKSDLFIDFEGNCWAVARRLQVEWCVPVGGIVRSCMIRCQWWEGSFAVNESWSFCLEASGRSLDLELYESLASVLGYGCHALWRRI